MYIYVVKVTVRKAMCQTVVVYSVNVNVTQVSTKIIYLFYLFIYLLTDKLEQCKCSRYEVQVHMQQAK